MIRMIVATKAQKVSQKNNTPQVPYITITKDCNEKAIMFSLKGGARDVVQGGKNLLPLLDKLSTMDVPHQLVWPSARSSDKHHAYEATVKKAKEVAAGALALRSSDMTSKDLEYMLSRGNVESLKAYRARIMDLKKEMKEDIKSAKELLNEATMYSRSQGAESQEGEFATTSDEELKEMYLKSLEGGE